MAMLNNQRVTRQFIRLGYIIDLGETNRLAWHNQPGEPQRVGEYMNGLQGDIIHKETCGFTSHSYHVYHDFLHSELIRNIEISIDWTKNHAIIPSSSINGCPNIGGS